MTKIRSLVGGRGSQRVLRTRHQRMLSTLLPAAQRGGPGPPVTGSPLSGLPPPNLDEDLPASISPNPVLHPTASQEVIDAFYKTRISFLNQTPGRYLSPNPISMSHMEIIQMKAGKTIGVYLEISLISKKGGFIHNSKKV